MGSSTARPSFSNGGTGKVLVPKVAMAAAFMFSNVEGVNLKPALKTIVVKTAGAAAARRTGQRMIAGASPGLIVPPDLLTRQPLVRPSPQVNSAARAFGSLAGAGGHVDSEKSWGPQSQSLANTPVEDWKERHADDLRGATATASQEDDYGGIILSEEEEHALQPYSSIEASEAPHKDKASEDSKEGGSTKEGQGSSQPGEGVMGCLPKGSMFPNRWSTLQQTTCEWEADEWQKEWKAVFYIASHGTRTATLYPAESDVKGDPFEALEKAGPLPRTQSTVIMKSVNLLYQDWERINKDENLTEEEKKEQLQEALFDYVMRKSPHPLENLVAKYDGNQNHLEAELHSLIKRDWTEVGKETAGTQFKNLLEALIILDDGTGAPSTSINYKGKEASNEDASRPRLAYGRAMWSMSRTADLALLQYLKLYHPELLPEKMKGFWNTPFGRLIGQAVPICKRSLALMFEKARTGDGPLPLMVEEIRSTKKTTELKRQVARQREEAKARMPKNMNDDVFF
ncbi:unnamed protein product [Amoebophrya sp. A25]|nr:unnamed protein product [Amoebophrya sp. A25]|eukprot:GSA25T00017301001.1